MQKVLFVDLHNALHRASIVFKNSQEVNQDFVFVFNFFRNLRPIVEMFSPNKIYMCREGHPQFRYDLYSEYKANRLKKYASVEEKQEKMDKFFHFRDQVLDLLQYLPITIVRAVHFEADDLIATLCENLKDEDLTILSNDNDYIQLLQKGYNNIQIYNPIKKTFLQAPEYSYLVHKCLVGDKSDNIKGLLTPKKALNTVSSPDLFEKFLSIEENRAKFSINRKLIEFANVPLEDISTVDGCRNYNALKEEFTRMEFNSIINDNSWNKFCTTFDCLDNVC